MDLFRDSRTFFTSLDTDICTKICDICKHHKNTASWHKNKIWEKRACFGFVGSIRDSSRTWGFTVRNWNLQHLQSALSWQRGGSWKHSPNPCFRNKHNELLTSLLPVGIKPLWSASDFFKLMKCWKYKKTPLSVHFRYNFIITVRFYSQAIPVVKFEKNHLSHGQLVSIQKSKSILLIMRQFQICVTRCQNLFSSGEGQKKITDGSRPEVISQLAELRPRPEEGGRGVSFYGGGGRGGNLYAPSALAWRASQIEWVDICVNKLSR